MTFPRFVARAVRGRVNDHFLRLAGRGSLADLEHVGRRSGLPRHTPVRAFRRGDTVVIGLNFGPGTEWLKNIEAAGGARLRLGRDLLTLGPPTVVPLERATALLPWWFAFALRHLARTRQCVELPVTNSLAWVEPSNRLHPQA